CRSRRDRGVGHRLVCLLIVGCAVRLLLRPDTRSIEEVDPGSGRRVAVAVAATAAFVPVFAAIGMPVPGFALLLVWLRLFGESWKVAITVAVLGVVAVHVLFVVVLQVPLPVGPLAPGV
ncbi:tripartite tricarboxylate transporter TctB family protein, partial [Pseudonocardia pini]|uniref:tripartite tricarboxylate transporter TctB family protein n=1 Tax=Pseudonocardia pini TaxID=2758030 RepID=UPI0015F0C50C